MAKNILILDNAVLADSKFKLNRYTVELTNSKGERQQQIREVFDRGDGAAILLYNPVTKKIILTKQFRLPTYLNGNTDGMLLEVCAGMLDADDPESCIIRETEEETGYKLASVKKVFEAFLSPGGSTEKLHFFVGEYNEDMKFGNGGGLASEQEDIIVVEMNFNEAFQKMEEGLIQDARTIMLLQYVKIHQLIES